MKDYDFQSELHNDNVYILLGKDVVESFYEVMSLMYIHTFTDCRGFFIHGGN